MGEVRVTEELVLAELEAEGVHATQIIAFAELGPTGVYVTQQIVFAEIVYVEPEDAMPTYFPSNAGTRAIHRLLPDEITGYAFDPEYSWWSTIVAEASVNLIANPSFEAPTILEYATGGGAWLTAGRVEFPAVGATAGRAVYRLVVDEADTYLVYDDGVAVTPGNYTFACDVYVNRPGSRILLAIYDGVTKLAERTFLITETGWKRYDISYVELGSGTRKMRMGIVGSWTAGTIIYTDAWQFEAKAYPTTYFDGNSIGFNDVRPYQSYYWLGEPMRSASARHATTGSGGRIVSWSEHIGFMTTSIVGLAISPVDLDLEVLGDGREINKGSRGMARTFTITGRIFADNPRQLLKRENRMVDLLRPNRTLDGEQLILRYQEINADLKLVGPPLDIICAYSDGLQGNMTNFYQQSYALQFRASQPYMREVIESSADLALYKDLVENFVVFRDGDGELVNLGTGSSNNFPLAVGFMPNGYPFAIGPFTQLAGDTVSAAAYWDGANWVQMGTFTSSANDLNDGFRTGYPLAVAKQNGNVSIYNFNTDTWSDLGTGFDAAVNAIDRDPEGNLWVGGTFIQDSGALSTYNLVAKWNYELDQWDLLGQGLTDPDIFIPGTNKVNTVLYGDDGYVYFGGNFGRGTNTAGTVTTLASGAIRWDIAADDWEAMGAGFDDAPLAFVRGADGYIYATGPFTTDSTATQDLRGLARWNGYRWEEPFALLRVNGAYGADGMRVDEDGVMWFYAYVTASPDNWFNVPELGQVPHFGWKDGVFYPPFGTFSIQEMAIGPGNRTIYATRSVAGFGGFFVASFTEIDYPGTADAPLAIYMHGAGHPYSIENLDTKGGIYFRESFTLGETELMVARADAQRPLLYSNVRDNLKRFVSAGPSNLSALRLRPGINRISIYMPDPVGDAEVWCVWRNHYQALSGPIDD